jgi:hypothetical protein
VQRHLVWLLVVVAQLYCFPYFQRLNNPNENVRVWMTRALVDYHELDLTRVTHDWGFVDDKAWSADGRLVSSKAPGTSLLGVPVYAVESGARRILGLPAPPLVRATWALRVFSVTLPLAGFLFFFKSWVEAVTGSAVARDLLVLGLGLGTPFYPYSIMFVGHAQGAALAFLAFALIGDVTPVATRGLDAGKRLLLAGLFAGLAVVFEYQLAVVAALLVAWASVRHKQSAWRFVLGLVPAGLALCAYHAWLFGSPWAFPYGHLENPTFAATHHTAGFFGLGLPSAGALASLTLSPDLGLFAFSPFLLLGVAGGVYALRKGPRDAGAVLLGLVAAMLLFQSGMSNWQGGWSVGPRYAVVVAPLLAASVAWLWPSLPEATRAPLVGGLVGASVLQCGVSGAMFPHYPPAFDNPVFELAWPLLRAGYAPHNLGRLVGLRGWASMVPLGICAATAWTLAMRGTCPSRETSPVRAAAAVLGAAAVVWSLSLPGRAAEPEESDATRMVEVIWEPRP